MKRSRIGPKTFAEAKARLKAKQGKKPSRYGLARPLAGLKRGTPPTRAGKRTKAWEAERRKLKVESERAGLTTCELRGVIPHECTYDNFLGYAHSKKRRHIQGDELSEAALACNNGHDILERLPEAEMTVIIRSVIASREIRRAA